MIVDTGEVQDILELKTLSSRLGTGEDWRRLFKKIYRTIDSSCNP